MRRRSLSPIARRLRQENWLAMALLLGAFAALVLGVTSAVNGLEFGLLWFPVLFGLATGWLLAASRLSGRLAAVLVLIFGPALIMIQIGNLGRPLAALALSLFRLLREAIISGQAPAFRALSDAWIELAGATSALGTRLFEWLLALGRGQRAVDPVAVAALWLLVLLGTAVWASWSLRRRNRAVSGLLPGLILVAAMLTVTGGSALFLLPALALTLILRASVTHRVREQSWRTDGISYSPRFGSNATWTAAGLALALMVLALITPSLSIYRLVEAARNLNQGRQGQDVARSLGLESSSAGGEVDIFASERAGGLPASHLIGSGPELSQQPVMAIAVEGQAGQIDRPRYWRGLTYDLYTGRGWQTGATSTIAYKAGETTSERTNNQQLVRQEVQPLDGGGRLLYTDGALLTVDQPYQVAWRARNRVNETYLDAFAASTPDGETGAYRADSLVPIYDEAKLRAAGQNLPNWITERYLELPDQLSGRVLALARNLTATEPTPYDRALAIERHLRQFPYTLDLPAPPSGLEIADYFLFDLQRGYCDYYATTMVVLARAAGLPARLVTGYIGGAYDEANRRYTVTADLAHSWPELYFPGYGWIPFEPTAGRAAIDRVAELDSASEIQPGPDQAELEPITAAGQRRSLKSALGVAAALLLATGALVLAWWLLDIWRLRLLAPGRAITGLFERLNRSGRRLGVEGRPGETPHEFAGRLRARLLTLSHSTIGSASLDSAPEAIDWLIALYTLSLYGAHEPEARQRSKAIRTWWRLRTQLLWAALLLRIAGITGRRT